jgi:hypothetical protein
MTTIIRYIAGFPKSIEPSSKIFDEVRQEYGLKKENVDVLEYRGPLTSADFQALKGVLTSEQYFKLRESISLKDKKRFLDCVEVSILDESKLTSKCYEEQLKSLSETSKNFLPVLEELVNQEDAPLCYCDAQEYLLEQAKKSGLHPPISFSYPYENIEDLAYDKKVLVFADEILKGEVTLKKTKEYFDQWVGQIEEGVATIIMENRIQNVDWNLFQSNSLRFIVDPEIRKKILNEKEKGISFTRL